jgi:hypothetical protein
MYRKNLKFIHITKNAGTSIEDVSVDQGMLWGVNHRQYGFWHEKFPRKPMEMRQRYDWFMVVRNPYTRILSEYAWLVSDGYVKPKNPRDKDFFNKTVCEWLEKVENDEECHHQVGKFGGDHFTEQYKYLDPFVNIHILKFENLAEDFKNLMNEYHYNIILNKNTNSRHEKYVSLNDLYPETIALIQRVYRNDFLFFGYSMDPMDPHNYKNRSLNN